MLNGTRTFGNMKALLFTTVALVLSATAFTSPALANYGDKVSDGFIYTDNGSEVTITSCENQNFCGTSIVIPSTIDSMPVTAVAEYAFAYNNSDITDVSLPNTLTTIGRHAFIGDDWIGSINIPDSVTSMGDSAFYGCQGLTSITIGTGLTQIPPFAFTGASSLANLSLPNTLTTVGEGAFRNSGLVHLTIPASVTSIGDQAFGSDSYLQTVIFKGNAPTSISVGAFNGSSYATLYRSPTLTGYGNDGGHFPAVDQWDTRGLLVASDVSYYLIGDNAVFTGCAPTACSGDVTIPASINGHPVTGISNGAFQDATGLTSVTIPNTVTTIGGSAFQGATALASITIPNTVTTIDASAFQGATALTTVTFAPGSTLRYIGDFAFWGDTNLTGFTIPNTVTDIGNYAFTSNTSMTSITIPSSVASLGVCDFLGNTALESVTFAPGSTLTHIPTATFSSDNKLASVSLPASLVTIGEDAFYGTTSLVNITIPSNVTTLGPYSFQNATGLKDVTFSGVSKLTTVGTAAFMASGLEHITLPKSVTAIGNQAFVDSASLATVVFSGNAPSVGLNAFSGVASGAKAQRLLTLTGYGDNGSSFNGLVVTDGLGWAWPLTPATPVVTVTKTGITLTTSVATAGAGVLSQVATTKVGRLTATWCKTSRSASLPGTYTLTCKLSSHARTSLRKAGMNITLKTTLALTRGKKATVSQAVRVDRAK